MTAEEQLFSDVTTPQGRAGWAAIIADPAAALIALDFDGVLSPIVADPEQAYVLPAAVDAMAELGGRIGTLAVITGRPVQAALRLGGFAGRAGLEKLIILGQYGVERWDAATGELTTPEPPAEIQQVRDRLPALLAECGQPDLYVEDKGRAIGVHTRRASDPQAALDAITGPLLDLADELGLQAEPGRNVVEIRAAGFDKGSALQGLVAERTAGAVAYAGDDLGDLAAFDTVDRLRAAGTPGLLLCSASDEQDALRPRADVVCAGPAGIAAFLTHLAGAL
ncbi:trehalose-phosphatase [Granulicoccus phenolivorans]|uniref:trehalose-phosphatase n=1 Tax=Granulicoccus phenolivorans TaxID=266854 RepID=UPI0005570506|nr:trehalose-phosphatase [Granulicoccus phenolivorans]